SASDERDVVFGATVAGRPADLAGVEAMVGPFINAVPVRAAIDDAASFSALAVELHRQAIEAQAFEDSLLPDGQQASRVGLGHPLFETLFVFENYPLDGRGAGGGDLHISVAGGRELTHYDVVVEAVCRDTLRFRLSYAPDVFDADTAEGFARALHA